MNGNVNSFSRDLLQQQKIEDIKISGSCYSLAKEAKNVETHQQKAVSNLIIHTLINNMRNVLHCICPKH